MTLRINITWRERKRRLQDGTTKVQDRYVLNYRDPRTGDRHQLFFRLRKDAEARRDKLVAEYQERGSLALQRASLTVAEAIARWLDNREGEIRERTMDGYRRAARYITGPVARGTSGDRRGYTRTIGVRSGIALLPSLGSFKVQDLLTADIRGWHKAISQEVGIYTANRAKMFLKTALSLAAEDLNVRPPPMPSLLGRGRIKVKKAILTPIQIKGVLEAAATDLERGIYVAFPFLAGTRPSEQLGLLWPEVDFTTDVIRIRRTQGQHGELIEATKTEAGVRDIPMGPVLRQMLLEWKLRCPRVSGELHRVFPGLGRLQAFPKPRIAAGGALEYHNFRTRMWKAFFKRHDLPYVTPHSARHSFISILQMEGIEIGLVAKIAGHSNPAVTLGYYTQAVRGGAEAAAALEHALRT